MLELRRPETTAPARDFRFSSSPVLQVLQFGSPVKVIRLVLTLTHMSLDHSASRRATQSIVCIISTKELYITIDSFPDKPRGTLFRKIRNSLAAEWLLTL